VPVVPGELGYSSDLADVSAQDEVSRRHFNQLPDGKRPFPMANLLQNPLLLLLGARVTANVLR
jgi:hypothetical protein